MNYDNPTREEGMELRYWLPHIQRNYHHADDNFAVCEAINISAPRKYRYRATVTSRQPHCISDNRELQCLLNIMFRLNTKLNKTQKTPKLYSIDTFWRESTDHVANEFPLQSASSAKCTSILWRHLVLRHGTCFHSDHRGKQLICAEQTKADVGTHMVLKRQNI